MSKQDYYFKVMKDFHDRHGLTEEEFLRIYNSKGEEREKLLKNLSQDLRNEIVHLVVAYSQYLRSIGEK